MSQLLKIVDSISHWSGELVKHAIWVMVVILCYEVLMRYFFNAPTIWAHQITQQLFGAYAVLLGAYCLRYGHHVKIDLVYGALSRRKQAIFDSFTFAFVFLFLSLMLWRGTLSAVVSFMQGEVPHVIVFKPPLWPLRATIPLAAALTLLQGLANWVRSLAMAFTGKELA